MEKQVRFHFHWGQIVKHKSGACRGVIFGRDAVCQADEEWYNSQPCRPRRGQPWYHLLVDGGTETLYAAENELEPDDSGQPVEHPLIGQYFPTFLKGCYYQENLN